MTVDMLLACYLLAVVYVWSHTSLMSIHVSLDMPRHNMDLQRSQWEPVQKSPWIMRLAVEQSPASSGAESDTEGSSTESERVNHIFPLISDQRCSTC